MAGVQDPGVQSTTKAALNNAALPVATWFIDPQNVQGTSSDANDGTTTATALRTYAELVNRWGTTSPSVSQSTSVTFLSSHTDNTDPVIFTPIRRAGAVCSIQGAAPTTTAAVFTRNAAKSRAAGSNAMLSGSFSAGVPAAGVMVENTTAAKSSRAVVHSSAGGANWNMTQPLAKTAVPQTTAAPSEVDTWASTDTVNLLAPVQINVVRMGGTVADYNGAGDSFVYLYQCIVFDPQGVGDDPCLLEDDVLCMEVVFQRGVSYRGDSRTQASGIAAYNPSFVNCYFLGGFFCITGGNFVQLVGGGTNNFTNLEGYASLDGDYIAGGFGLTLAGRQSIGFCFFDSNIICLFGIVNFATQNYGGHVLYGTTGKTVNFQGNSRAIMASGTWAAGWTQATLVATGAQLNGSSTGQTHTNASPDVVTSAVATTVANADAATGGTMQNWGGAILSKAA